MDTRTGKIYDLPEGVSIKSLAKEIGAKPSDLVPVGRRPDGTCRRCNGTGAVRRGLFSKRFKPCRCTMESK